MRKLAVLFLVLALTAGAVACEDMSKEEGAPTLPPTAAPSSTPPTCTPEAIPTGEAAGTAVPTVEGQPTVQNDCLVIYDIVVGTGTEAKPGDTVSVNYTGWLSDGTVFDATSKHSPPDPSQFSLDQVITGWTEGIPGMQIGGKRRLVIPPGLAYGAAGRTGIPPNATLTFDVELVSIP